jgi:hypothetical protein
MKKYKAMSPNVFIVQTFCLHDNKVKYLKLFSSLD